MIEATAVADHLTVDNYLLLLLYKKKTDNTLVLSVFFIVVFRSIQTRFSAYASSPTLSTPCIYTLFGLLVCVVDKYLWANFG